MLSTKKRYSSFLKKFFVFLKIQFRIKVLKTFKISSDCHIKACRSLKWSAILKIPNTVFLEEPMFFLLALKWNLRNAISFVKTEANSNLAVTVAVRSNYSFSDYLMNHLFQTSLLFNPYSPNIIFLYPPKTSENRRFYDVSGGTEI